MLVCLYEDRREQLPGLKLAILSLSRYNSAWPIRLRFPGASSEFRSWLERFPNLSLIDEKIAGAGSYNVKPSVLLDGLRNSDECLWLDTDVIVNASLGLVQDDSPETVTVAQDPWEYASGSTHRCRSWGLEPGRDLSGPLNTAVLRVSSRHGELLSAWRDILADEDYLREQRKPAKERNQHLLGDQDALSALLASTRFQSIPVHLLRHSREILQHHGAGAYGLKHRWQNLRADLPPLIHAMGTVKPWKAPDHPNFVSQSRDYYERIYLELSPYVHVARQYQASLEEETGWMDVQTIAGKLDSWIALGHPCLKGALQATVHRALARLH